MPVTFSAAIARAPLRPFQVTVALFALLLLVVDGIDLQSLPLLTPPILEEWGIDRAAFGPALAASLFGMGFGSILGGMIGDRIGRLRTLFIACLIFGLATIGAAFTDGVWEMSAVRALGGLGFGAAYPNALALVSDWVPDRWRANVVSLVSIGIPVGISVGAAVMPYLLPAYGWRGAFVAFGLATLLIVVLIVAGLRDSPSFLLVRGKPAEAKRAAARLLGNEVDLLPETHSTDTLGGSPIGVLHRSNLRLNIGIGITFAACALCAYGVLNWSTTFLTAKGFTLAQAGNAVSIGGLTSIVSSVAAGLLVHRFGSKTVMATISATLVISFIVLAISVERLPAVPSADDRLLVVVMIGITAAIFSAGMASMYALMTYAYPLSCRSAGIGFGIFVARVGAISASGLGGWLLELGHGSTVPYFAVLTVSAALMMAAPLIVDRHVRPASRKPALA